MFWVLQYFFPSFFSQKPQSYSVQNGSLTPPITEEIIRDEDEVEEEEEIIDVIEDNISEPDTRNRIFTENEIKKALVIGINYNTNEPSNDDLRGCVNDCNNIQDYLQNNCFFRKDQITVLTDADATRNNIMNQLDEMVTFAHNNVLSELWLSYSGHGSQINGGNENDGKNEVLCPVDYLTKGIINDDYLKTHFLQKLPKTTKLFIIMDCCHSGSNMDLTYAIENGVIVDRNESNIDASVIKLSGCLDSQVSMDVYNRNMNEFQGAFTDAFVNNNGMSEVSELVNNINTYLQTKKYTQISQLSFSKKELLDYHVY